MDREISHPRAAKYRASRLQDVLSHIDLARRSLEAIGIDHPELLDLRIKCVQELNRCTAIASERTEPRARKKQATWEGVERKEYFLFLDECGSHVPSAAETAFPVFALSGVIIERKAYENVDHQWKEWKQAFLGSDTLIHEPNARLRTSTFRGSSFEHAMEIQQTLNNMLTQLDFACVASVVDLRRFKEEYPDSFVDEFLPRSCYLMSIDFVLERFIHFFSKCRWRC